jgi:hypothetical protein
MPPLPSVYRGPSSWRNGGLALCVLVLAVVLTVSPAVALSATWSTVAVPSAKASTASVSCASTSLCFSVGSLESGFRTDALLREWTGTEWLLPSLKATFNPEGAGPSSLAGVSCASTKACTAVGKYTNSSGTKVTLAERYEGFWFPQTTPNPKEAFQSELAAISCSSSELCTAVGTYLKGFNMTLAERWNGKEWTIQETPNPKENKGVELLGVSCPAAETCIAVGKYTSSTGSELTLAERWNGKEWTIQETPNPKEAMFSRLSSISCTSTTACTAVGYSRPSVGVRTVLAERWNGATWVIQETPNPKEAKSSELASVSCATSEACSTVGKYTSSTGIELTLAERWNGKAWTIQETPNPGEAKSAGLLGISCAASEECAAVGRYTQTGNRESLLGESLSGATWSTVAVPSAKASTASVSCASTSLCFSVGSLESGFRTDALLREWTGTEWLLPSLKATFNPEGAGPSSLAGVSCASTKACTAVGKYTNSSGTKVTLAERYEGFWFPQTTPNPKEAFQSELAAISCSSSELCTAVGTYLKGFNMTLAERWNGKEWTIQETPNPKENKGVELLGVSCPAAETCIAVGKYTSSTGSELTLAERWNGKEWTIQETPNPKEAMFSRLSSISCTSTTACTAVGYSRPSVGVRTVLAERWNGATWVIQETPNPKEAKSSELASVSCATSEACSTVGKYTSSTGIELTLAERWNGKAWTIQETPNPGEAKSAGLLGISCAASEECAAVGRYTQTGNRESLLGVTYR